ncbi:unnamed protein product, partial [marine sediment metagenome]
SNKFGINEYGLWVSVTGWNFCGSTLRFRVGCAELVLRQKDRPGNRE